MTQSIADKVSDSITSSKLAVTVDSITQEVGTEGLHTGVPYFLLNLKDDPSKPNFLTCVPLPQSLEAAQQINSYFEEGRTLTIETSQIEAIYMTLLRFIKRRYSYVFTGVLRVQDGPTYNIQFDYFFAPTLGILTSHTQTGTLLNSLERVPEKAATT